MSCGKGLTNAERTDIKNRRQDYLDIRIPEGVKVDFEVLWHDMFQKGLTKGCEKKNFKATLSRYGYRSRDNMIMRRDTPLPPRKAVAKPSEPPIHKPLPEDEHLNKGTWWASMCNKTLETLARTLTP